MRVQSPIYKHANEHKDVREIWQCSVKVFPHAGATKFEWDVAVAGCGLRCNFHPRYETWNIDYTALSARLSRKQSDFEYWSLIDFHYPVWLVRSLIAAHPLLVELGKHSSIAIILNRKCFPIHGVLPQKCLATHFYEGGAIWNCGGIMYFLTEGGASWS